VSTVAATNVQAYIEVNASTVATVGVESSGAGNVVTLNLFAIETLAATDLVRLKVICGAGNYVIESFTTLSGKFIRQTT
jgi:hypothetical protein